MTKSYLSDKSCAGCFKTLKLVKRKYVNEVSSTEVVNRLNNYYKQNKIKIGDLVCNACKCDSYKLFKTSSSKLREMGTMSMRTATDSENMELNTLEHFQNESINIIEDSSSSNFANEMVNTNNNSLVSSLIDEQPQLSKFSTNSKLVNEVTEEEVSEEDSSCNNKKSQKLRNKDLPINQ